MPRLAAIALAVMLSAALAGCDGGSSSGSADASTAASSAPASSSTSAAAADPRSQALCSALTNAVGSGAEWTLGAPEPTSHVVAGVAVPSCQAVGDSGTRLTAAYLADASGLTGADLLAALCQAVVKAKPAAGARACSAPKQGAVKAGTEVRRADLAAGDAGVLVLSFASKQPEYVRSAVADLGTVGQALADDPLLARAIG